MPFDSYHLKLIKNELQKTIVGGRIDKLTMPDPFCVVISFRHERKNRDLVINMGASFPSLFVGSYPVGEKNTAANSLALQLRKQLIGGVILSVTQPPFERVLEFEIEAHDIMGYTSKVFLIAEIMGKYSNIFLLNNNRKIVALLKQFPLNMNAKRPQILGSTYLPPPEQSKVDIYGGETLLRHLAAFEGGKISSYLLKELKGYAELTLDEIIYRAIGTINCDKIDAKKSQKIVDTLVDFYEKSEDFYSPCTLKNDDGLIYDFCGFPLTFNNFKSTQVDSLNEAASLVLNSKLVEGAFVSRHRQLAQVLKTAYSRSEKKLGLLRSKMLESTDYDKHRIKGDLIMSNLHRIKTGDIKVNLENFFEDNCPLVEITLNENLSPQKNAAVYYKKYAKAKRGFEQSAIFEKEAAQSADYLDELLSSLSLCSTLSELDELAEEMEFSGLSVPAENTGKKRVQARSMPIREDYGAHLIMVGKNNLQNDMLVRTANGNDLWFHVKLFHGSHVVLAGKNPPEHLILRAAQLAAFFSKSRHADKVDVDMTQIKYVKKQKNASLGKVTYVNQRTLTVTPKKD